MVSADASVMPVPPEPAVPMLWITTFSASVSLPTTIVWPMSKPATLSTLMFVAPVAAAAASAAVTPAGPETPVPVACANASADTSVMPVPAAPAVPTVEIVTRSAVPPEPIVIVWPAARPVTAATLMLVAPSAAAAASVVEMPPGTAAASVVEPISRSTVSRPKSCGPARCVFTSAIAVPPRVRESWIVFASFVLSSRYELTT